MECHVVESTETLVRVALVGDLNMEGVGKIELQFLASTVATGKHAIVDISAVPFMSSLGMGLLLNCHNGLKRRGRKMVVLKPQPLIEMALNAARLTQLLQIQHDDQAAIQLLSEQV